MKNKLTVTKWALALTALATTAVMGSACSKKSSSSGTPTPAAGIANGAYTLSGVSATNGDTCYSLTAANSAGVLTIEALGGAGSFTVSSASATAFTLSPPTVAASLLPSFNGTISGTTLSGTSTTTSPIILTTSCTLDISGSMTGTITGTNTFSATVTLNIAVATTGSNGNAGTCASFTNSAGNPVIPPGIDILPFPTLSPSDATGSCAAPVAGVFTGPT